jgi:hypothetical protein
VTRDRRGRDRLVITYGYESSALFFVIYKAGRGPNAVLMIGLYELLDNPTT